MSGSWDASDSFPPLVTRRRATSSRCPETSCAHCYTLSLGLLPHMAVVCGCCVGFALYSKLPFLKKFFFSFLVSGSGWLAGTTCPSACFVLLFQQPVSQVFHTVIRGIFKKLGVVGCYLPTGTWPPLWAPEPGLCIVVLPTHGFLEPCIWQWSSRTCEVSPWLGGGPSSRGHTGFRQVVCEVACVS